LFAAEVEPAWIPAGWDAPEVEPGDCRVGRGGSGAAWDEFRAGLGVFAADQDERAARQDGYPAELGDFGVDQVGFRVEPALSGVVLVERVARLGDCPAERRGG
jgi:hypothetical protein